MISVGNTHLPIDKCTGGLIIDSGTTITYNIDGNAFDSLEKRIHFSNKTSCGRFGFL